MIQLRDNTTTTDRRLDLIQEFDKRRLSFRVQDILPSQEPISKVWYVPDCLNQGQTGGCAGYATTAILRAEPGIGDRDKLDNKFATELYWMAQSSDQFPGGEYPGGDGSQGTTLSAVLKEARELRKITGWKNAFTLQDLILGIGYCGPALLGTIWRDGMQWPDRDGRVHYKGKRLGGHAYIARGVNLPRKKILCQNSWGIQYGLYGLFWMSFDDGAAMIEDGCEMVFVEKSQNVLY